MSYYPPPPPRSPGRSRPWNVTDNSQSMSKTEGDQLNRRVPLSSESTRISDNTRNISLEARKPLIRRAMSSPNVRKQVQLDAGSSNIASKKRNKLEYHRASLACGHCRRRKIRCILAPNDAQQRCSNCIRLKKECVFHPVDQQPPLPSEDTRKDVKSSSFRDDSVSPLVSVVDVPYRLNAPSAEGSLVSSRRPRIDAIGVGTRSSSYRGGVATFDHPSSVWPLTDTASMASRAPANISNPNQWRSSHDQSGSAYGVYTLQPHNVLQSAWNSTTPEERVRGESGWPSVQRSMSFGSLDSVSQQQPLAVASNAPFLPYQASIPHHVSEGTSPRQRESHLPNMFVQVPVVPSHTAVSESMHRTPITTPPAIDSGHVTFPHQGQPWTSYTFERASIPGGVTAQAYAPAFYTQDSSAYPSPPMPGQHVIYGSHPPAAHSQQYNFYPPSSNAP